jgi:hypothetical protein
MKIKGIIWLGTRTDRFDQMSDFCRDLLGLKQTLLEPGFAVFDLPNGTGWKYSARRNLRTNL